MRSAVFKIVRKSRHYFIHVYAWHFVGDEYFRLICRGLDQIDRQVSTIVRESNKGLTVLFDEIFVQATNNESK